MDYYVNLEHRSEEYKKYHEENRGKYATVKERATTSTVAGRSNSRRNRMKKKFKFFSVRSGMDMPFLFLVIVLLVIGVVMMFSASYAYAYYTMGDSYYFLKRQLLFAVIGVLCMFFISYFDYHHFHKAAVVILGIAFLLLGVVLVLPPINYVHRWINLGFTMLQPSEIMKFALILFFAHWGSVYFTRMNTFKYGVLPAICILVPTIILLIMEPHYSCIVIVTILTMIMKIGRASC